MSQYSEYVTGEGNVPSYQQSQCGPWGVRLNEQIQHTSELNVPFDPIQWEEAKQNGCMPMPCAAFPTWPPPVDKGFIYPSLSKTDQHDLMGADLGPGTQSVPYISPPKLNTPCEQYKNRQYSPEEILNGGDGNCGHTISPALPGMCVGPMPYKLSGNAFLADSNEERKLRGRMPGEKKRLNESILVDPPSKPIFSGANDSSSNGSGGNSGDNNTSDNNTGDNNTGDNNTSDNNTGDNNTNNENVLPPPIIFAVNNIDTPSNTNSNMCQSNPTKCNPFDLENLFPCIKNSVKGVMYDLACWNDLPNKPSKFAWVLTRDDRLYYLGALILIIGVLAISLKVLWKCIFPSACGQKRGKVMSWGIILGLFTYWLTPSGSKSDNIQKGIAVVLILIIMGVITFTWNFEKKTCVEKGLGCIASRKPQLLRQELLKISPL